MVFRLLISHFEDARITAIHIKNKITQNKI